MLPLQSIIHTYHDYGGDRKTDDQGRQTTTEDERPTTTMTTEQALAQIGNLGGTMMQDSNPEVRALGAAIFTFLVAHKEGGKQDMDRLIFKVLEFIQERMTEKAQEEEQLEGLLSDLNISFSNED
jgi:hypothetical protein